MPEQIAEHKAVDESENLSQVFPKPETASAGVFVGVCVGRVVALCSEAPLVDYPTNSSGELIPARSLVPITQKELGKPVVLAFEENDAAKPIILGLLPGPESRHLKPPDSVRPVNIAVDGEMLTLHATSEVTLRCGKASITLTSAGKILIEGEYVSSRSSGVNKIRGASVQIN